MIGKHEKSLPQVICVLQAAKSCELHHGRASEQGSNERQGTEICMNGIKIEKLMDMM